MQKNECGIIDFMRLVCAIVVVLLHSIYLTDESIQRFVPHGHLAVEFFLIVTGYLMAKKALNLNDLSKLEPAKETEQYILKKYKGLIPYLLFGWVMAYIALCTNPTFTGLNRLASAVSSIFQLLCVDMCGIDGYQMMGATWYISAILLVMPILYYLLKKWPEVTSRITIPLIMLVLYGIQYQEYGIPIGVHDWNGVVYMGVLRACAGLCLGCICYRISVCISGKKYSIFARIIFTIVELFGYFAVLFTMTKESISNDFTFTMLLILALSISISFSKASYTCNWFQLRLFNRTVGSYMRDLSVGIYLSHARWQGFVIRVFVDKIIFKERLIPYLVLSIVSGCLCVVFVRIWNKFFDCFGSKIKKLILKY